MSRLPVRRSTPIKRGFAAKTIAAGKKSSAPKKKPALQQRLTRKATLDNRPGRDRYFITAKDVTLIYRNTERSARRIINRIRKYYGKPPKARITLVEFCNWSGIPEQMIRDAFVFED